jgi:hypothetical protein
LLFLLATLLTTSLTLLSSLDAVEDLISNSNFAVTFDSMAKKLPDLERMLSRIHGKTCKKADFVKVVAAFELVNSTIGALKEQCDGFKSQGIEGLLEGAPDIEGLLEEIQGLYDGDGAFRSPPLSSLVPRRLTLLLLRTSSGRRQRRRLRGSSPLLLLYHSILVADRHHPHSASARMSMRSKKRSTRN